MSWLIMGTASKTNKPIDALDILIEQHDVVDTLIDRLESGELFGDHKLGVFLELADNIAAHAGMEEQLFYPQLEGRQAEALVLESGEEHLAMRRVLADMLETEVDDARFDAQLCVLKDEMTRHARETEEAQLFPLVRELMSPDELEALGGEMLALFEQLMATEPRKQIPNETQRPAVL